MKKFVYADNAATTRISEKVLDAMLPYLKEGYGNASSIYAKGREAKRAVEDAREKVARALGANPPEIYFTGCGSESDNWAVRGVMHSLAKRGKKHLITSVFEHHAVLNVAEELEKEGFRVTYLPVGEYGLVDPADVEAAIADDTALVSIMYANNEIGTIQPIAEIGAICKKHRVLFHTDAVQAVGNVHIDVKVQNIDLLSLSGHKFHAQKGVGALYIRQGVNPETFIYGGGQERGRRAGTENVAGIVGLGVAIEEAVSKIDEKAETLISIRDRLIDGLLQIPKSRLNGDREKRLPGLINISFEGIEGEAMLLLLDNNGICASSGSACTSGSLDPSHVLLSIGLVHEIAHGSLRLSFCEENTLEDADYILSVVPGVIERLRSMSPVWDKIEKGIKPSIL